MKLFTSYYANYRNIPKSYICIGISRVCPEWFADNSSLDNFMFIKSNFLAPSEELLNSYKNNSITQEDYKKQYVQQIYTLLNNSIGYKDLAQWIKDLIKTFSDKYDGIVFMCYERPEEFCHRHILRNILNNVYNIECKEFGVIETKESKKLF